MSIKYTSRFLHHGWNISKRETVKRVAGPWRSRTGVGRVCITSTRWHKTGETGNIMIRRARDTTPTGVEPMDHRKQEDCYASNKFTLSSKFCDNLYNASFAVFSTCTLFVGLYILNFYRAMHNSAKRGIAIACRPSVRLWRWWIRTTSVGNLGN